MKKVLSALVVAFLSGVPVGVGAQSIFNSAGLGRPVEAIDGRARAMGGVGIGLLGGAIAPGDPAAAALLGLPSAVMVSQPTWVEASIDGTDLGEFRGTRFPQAGLAYPFQTGMVTLQLGSVLDQRFRGEQPVTVDLGGAPAQVVDRFTQEGGASSVSLGYARPVTSTLAVGLNVSRYTGSVIRELTRDFGDLDLDGTESFTTTGEWSYSGVAVTAGASAQLGQVGRVAASARWSGALDAEASSTTEGEDRAFDMPMELRLGASAVLAPGLVLSASAVHADWSDAEDDLAGGGQVGDAHGFGIGLELSRTRFLGRPAPLRVGYRYAGLPFGLASDEPGSERAFSGGFGFAFNETNGILLAGADIAVERGERQAGSVLERFWRVTAAIRVSGF
jgi:hypothetical protein